jgi:hypothetical protein
MLYRKAPPQPARLLLRVVAVAGPGTLLLAAACQSSSSEGSVGSGPEPDSGYEDTTTDQVAIGIMAMPEAGSDGGEDSPSAFDGPVGLVDSGSEGGEDSPSLVDVLGVVPAPDSGQD